MSNQTVVSRLIGKEYIDEIVTANRDLWNTINHLIRQHIVGDQFIIHAQERKGIT
jgi:hypothetical protein